MTNTNGADDDDDDNNNNNNNNNINIRDDVNASHECMYNTITAVGRLLVRTLYYIRRCLPLFGLFVQSSFVILADSQDFKDQYFLK